MVEVSGEHWLFTLTMNVFKLFHWSLMRVSLKYKQMVNFVADDSKLEVNFADRLK